MWDWGGLEEHELDVGSCSYMPVTLLPTAGRRSIKLPLFHTGPRQHGCLAWVLAYNLNATAPSTQGFRRRGNSEEKDNPHSGGTRDGRASLDKLIISDNVTWR